MKSCRYCKQTSPTHWPFQCRENPNRPKYNLSKRGKHATRWKKTRRQWFLDNPQEIYKCYICGKPLRPIEVTLDHVKPRGSHPDLRYQMSNLKPACYMCNSKKGSQSLDKKWYWFRRERPEL